MSASVSSMPLAAPSHRPRVFLTAKQVRKRYGEMSEMTLWRWMRDPAMGFPQPATKNRIRYWSEAELDQWDDRDPADRSAA